jgi:GntR family carbon starvation induced transcriptional regulator
MALSVCSATMPISSPREALIADYGSCSLMEIHTSVFDRFVRYHMLTGSFRGRPVADDHKTLLDAALARDATKARQKLETHVGKCIEHVIGTGRIFRAA